MKATEITCPKCKSSHIALYTNHEAIIMTVYNNGTVVKQHDPVIGKKVVAAGGFCYGCQNLWRIKDTTEL